MIAILSKIFIKNNKDYTNPDVRRHYGELTSIFGIFLNICLFAGKFTIGFITHAISITADAFNNLSDAGSSIITLVGFKLSKQKPDNEHPFGHGRFEYLSGLFVAIIIILMAFELVKSGFGKLIHPEETEISIVTFIILAVSIVVKVYMFIYNKKYGKKISSNAMLATATDSISDSIATTVVLITSLLQFFFDIKIDAYAGIAVGLFIGYAGFKTLLETISPLLGKSPDPEFVKAIEETVLSEETVCGIHDMIVHDYGPTRTFVSLHAEVPADRNILEVHDVIDSIEMKIRKEMGIEITIHMDPIDTKDEKTKECKEEIKRIIASIDEHLTIHDFRMVHGDSHSNVLFDIVIPYEFDLSEEELSSTIERKLQKIYPTYYCVIEVDTDYTGAAK